MFRVRSIIDTSQNWAVPHRVPPPLSLHDDDFRVLINPYTYNPEASDENGKLKSTEKSLYSMATQSIGCPSEMEKVKGRDARNRLQSALFAASEAMLSVHISKIKSNESGTNMLLGVATTGLAATASVVNPAAAPSFAAAAAATNASRSLFNEEVFRNMLTEQVVTAIISKRTMFRERILMDHYKQFVDEYDVERAIYDALAYHEMGSFEYGLATVKADIESANTERLKITSKFLFVPKSKLTNPPDKIVPTEVPSPNPKQPTNVSP